jgi:F1F0 ATPase subunit 2
MREILNLILSLAAGIFLGGVFFGGLWWTVQKAVSASQPALWFLGSFLLRTGFVLGGVYLVFDSRFQQLIACFFGFILARFMMIFLTRPIREPEVRHASQS